MKATVDNELSHHSMRGAHCLSFAAFACPHMSVPFAIPSVIPLLWAATRGYIRYPRTYLPSLETLLLSYQKLLAILGWQRFAVWYHPLHVQNWFFRSQTAQADTRHTLEHAYRVSWHWHPCSESYSRYHSPTYNGSTKVLCVLTTGRIEHWWNYRLPKRRTSNGNSSTSSPPQDLQLCMWHTGHPLYRFLYSYGKSNILDFGFTLSPIQIEQKVGFAIVGIEPASTFWRANLRSSVTKTEG
jgi:hypothetical protein